MIKTVYKIYSNKPVKPFKIAVVSDLHDRPGAPVLSALEEIKPDLIAFTGDITSHLDRREGEYEPHDRMTVTHSEAFSLLRRAAELAPGFYCLGNHEMCGHKYRENQGRKCLRENLHSINESGIRLLDDGFVVLGNVAIGGLSTGMTNTDLRPKTGWLEGFAARSGYKILLCHHPEYYEKYLKKYDIDLILSGHAHGGQIRLFGRGLFAPSQGFLPEYTSGIYDGRLVVSRGLANTVRPIPRLFNPTELVTVCVAPEPNAT